VTILAVLQLLSAAAFGLVFGALLAAGPAVIEIITGEQGAGTGDSLGLEAWVITVLVGALAVAALAAGILLLRMRQLGWTLTMLLTGLGLAATIYIWWAQGTTITIWAMVEVLTVFYLNQRQVRVAFGISRRRAGDTLDQARG
jgi:hypothetical protein